MLEGKTVLVIDDDHSMLDLVERILSRADAQVLTAASGAAGLRQFYAHRPDLVILDIVLPDLDGLQVCARLRELSDVPILMLTGLEGDADMVGGLDCGADDYVTKPFSVDVLLARVRAVLRRAEQSPSAEQTLIYRDEHLSIDLGQQQVFVDQKPITQILYKNRG